jgi:hypothetical protein
MPGDGNNIMIEINNISGSLQMIIRDGNNVVGQAELTDCELADFELLKEKANSIVYGANEMAS